MSNWMSFNANPNSKRVGDCTVRAISRVLDQDWYDTYLGLCVQGYEMADMPSANHVWGAYLKRRGFVRESIPDSCPDCYTVSMFCEDHPRGRYILALYGHVIAVVDGEYFDTWDSGDEIPLYYWKREIGGREEK